MTASPTAPEHHAESAYCSDDLASEEAAHALNLAARRLQREFVTTGSEEEIEAAIWRHLGQAFDAKEREIERVDGEHAIYFDMAAKAQDRALSAEAKLEQAVKDEREACALIAETAADYLQYSTFDGEARAIRAIAPPPAARS